MEGRGGGVQGCRGAGVQGWRGDRGAGVQGGGGGGGGGVRPLDRLEGGAHLVGIVRGRARARG